MTLMHSIAAVPGSATVAIAGGGPSGMYLALRLAQHGIDSVIVEPRTEVDLLRPRAKTTNARTMTLLRGLGLADAVRSAAALDVSYSQDVIFCTGLTGHELRRFHGAFQLVDGDYELQPECGQQIPQPEVELVLREAVAASEHITFVTGVRATGVDRDTFRLLLEAVPEQSVAGAASAGSRLGADARSGSGTAPAAGAISARWIVGADGGASRVRRSLGIALQGASAPRPNFNVVFTSARLRERVTLDPAVQWWVVGEEVSGMIGELDRTGTWWAILQGCDPIEDPAEVAAALRALAGVGEDVDIEVLATDSWTARMLLADSYGGAESERTVFLVGDAAHLNPPWGGHGFNTCVSDAENLAWKLIAVTQGWAEPELLDSYEEERRPVAARMIADAAANGKALAYDFIAANMTEETQDGAAARARVREALEVKTSEFHSEGLVVGYEYAGTSRVRPGPVPFVDPIEYRPQALPGCLLPHFTRADGTSVYEGTGAVAFTLYTLAAAEAEAEVSALLTLAERHAIPLRHVRLGGSDARTAGALWSASAVLVRPDHHITAVAGDGGGGGAVVGDGGGGAVVGYAVAGDAVTGEHSGATSLAAFGPALLTACGLDPEEAR